MKKTLLALGIAVLVFIVLFYLYFFFESVHGKNPLAQRTTAEEAQKDARSVAEYYRVRDATRTVEGHINRLSTLPQLEKLISKYGGVIDDDYIAQSTDAVRLGYDPAVLLTIHYPETLSNDDMRKALQELQQSPLMQSAYLKLVFQ